MASGYWEHLCTSDFARLDPERAVALLPVAAVEQHGPHLPLATDALINEAVVGAALKLLPSQASVWVLPALDVGSSTEHTGFPGTLSLKPKTLLAVWRQIGFGVAAAGLRKLVIFNSHGGQKALVDLAALELRKRRAMLVVRANYFSFGSPPDLYSAADLRDDVHGGIVETSLLLHLRPELVRMENVRNFVSTPPALSHNHWLHAEKPIGFGWMSEDLNPAGAMGNAAGASAEKGAAHLAHLARGLADLLEEVSRTPLRFIDDAAPAP